jgi:hypothetical protein
LLALAGPSYSQQLEVTAFLTTRPPLSSKLAMYIRSVLLQISLTAPLATGNKNLAFKELLWLGLAQGDKLFLMNKKATGV